MPGAGGTGQPQQQMQQQPGTDLYDLLARRIAESLSGPEPQAPQPPQQQPLSPMSAFAAARNPQFAPMLNQQAQAPEQARYSQQQAAFEQAMSGRQQAMQVGGQLASMQNRNQLGDERLALGRDRLELDRQRMEGNLQARLQGLEIAAQNARSQQERLGIQQEMMDLRERMFELSKEKWASTPPPGALGQSVSMRVMYQDALKSYEDYLGKSSRLGRTVTSAGRRVPVVGGLIEENVLSYTDPEGVDVSRKIDNIADMLLRLRSGAQINEQEYQRLRSLLPRLGENPQTALANFRRFETELLTTLRMAYQARPRFFTPELMSSLGLSMQDLAGPANQDIMAPRSLGNQPITESVVDRAMRMAAEARARGGQGGSPNP